MTDADRPNLFDADNHYWEPSDAFTRYRDPAYADRGVQLAMVDDRLRYVVHGELHPWIPGPGDVNPRPRPGALFDYFAGRGTRNEVAASLTAENPAEHPEWFDRDARLKVMDAQGLDACWMFPSQGVCMEGPMQPDIDAAVSILRSFNRWLDDDWGFAYQNRIFSAPYMTLSDIDAAVAELDWSLDRGARIVALRPGPVFTVDGLRSPADPAFDPFWARVAESGVVVAVHGGFEDGHHEVEDAIARTWGYRSRRREGAVSSLAYYEPFVDALIHDRRTHDFLAALITHGLFERHPGARVASIENGATWVPGLRRVLLRLHTQNPGMFRRHPIDQLDENVWIAPFVEDDVAELARHMPVERILFGSDWPHAEGFAEPNQFLACLTGFSAEEQRKIIHGNAAALTFATAR
ncbi:amidohydrolase [Frankia sp. AgPm24]|uniref:amidohydrolase family protein n=1 Tax=Frankia sp. AgPm24 TaxID=631128 RepID=UPI00200C2F3F|nr:amidohydrolase family protein [Frankia sp. AgPm24]MCK9921529.1 amidohydrolase [Frankia sp. AgPm24]